METLELNDRKSFQDECRALAAGGLAAGALAAASLLAAGKGYSTTLLLMSFGGCVGTAAAWLDPDDTRALLRVVVGVLGGVAAFVVPGPVWVAGVVGGTLIGLALTVGESPLVQVGTALASGSLLAGGVWSTGTLTGLAAGVGGDVPLVSEVATTAAWSAFIVLAAGGRRLRWRRGDLTVRLREAMARSGAKESELLGDALEVAEEVQSVARRADDEVRRRVRRVADQTVASLVDLTRRSDQLREALAQGRSDRVAERLDAIGSEIDGDGAPELARELEASRDELADRRQAKDRLESELARLEVRQHRCISALERLAMAAAVSEEADASDGRLDSCVEEIDALNREVEWRRQSVATLLDGATESGDAPELDAGTVDDGEMAADSEEDDESNPRRGSGEAAHRTAYAFDGE